MKWRTTEYVDAALDDSIFYSYYDGQKSTWTELTDGITGYFDTIHIQPYALRELCPLLYCPLLMFIVQSSYGPISLFGPLWAVNL